MLVTDPVVPFDPAPADIGLNRHQHVEEDLVERCAGAHEIEDLMKGKRGIPIEQRSHDTELRSQMTIAASCGEVHAAERSVSLVRTTAPAPDWADPAGRVLRPGHHSIESFDDVPPTIIEDEVAFTIRHYRHPDDFDRVGRFLIETYRPGPRLINWLQPRWEYMFAHPFVDRIDVAAIGVAEAGKEILGVAHPEDHMAFVYFAVREERDEVKPALLDWAEAHFGAWSKGFRERVLGLWIDEHDEVLAALAEERGFEHTTRFSEPHAQRSLREPLPTTPMAAGYRIQSLAEENDFAKINRVLWRGFGHEGPPPVEEIAGRIRAQDTPGFRRDLTIVAVTPGDDYVSFAGLWVVPENRIAYVEPVATDPDYRRLGLGRAAVVESLRRAQAEGAEVAWVGSDQEFYASMGFEVTSRTNLYVRPLA